MAKKIMDLLGYPKVETVGSEEWRRIDRRKKFKRISQNTMNRIIDDIRRIGGLGDKYAMSDHEAHKMISRLEKEVADAKKKLKEREIVDGYSDPDYFTIDGD